MNKRPATLRPSGGYRRLRSFQIGEIIYDGTVSFYDRSCALFYFRSLPLSINSCSD